MTKSTITRTWIGGLAVFAAGIVAALGGVFLMLAYGGTFTQVADTSRYDFTPAMNGFFWVAVGVITIGGVLAFVGGIVQLAAWVGACFNSYMLDSKAWFAVLLLGGLLSFFLAPLGFAAMLAYVIAGEDGYAYRQAHPVMPPQQTGTLAPTA
jgi:hypothetical protein